MQIQQLISAYEKGRSSAVGEFNQHLCGLSAVAEIATQQERFVIWIANDSLHVQIRDLKTKVDLLERELYEAEVKQKGIRNYWRRKLKDVKNSL